MNIDSSIRKYVEVLFAPLNLRAASGAMPEIGHLSEILGSMMPRRQDYDIPLTPEQSMLFASAAVEIWQRGLHSFLISSALTNVSPIWASITGYYSSHYSVRAFAHMLGHFLLFGSKKLAIYVKLDNGAHICEARKKQGGSREHQYYWKVVKTACFSSDPLFTNNLDADDISDASHRNRANYADHVRSVPQFRPLSEEELKDRIQRISGIEISVPPIPDRRKFADLASIQIVAYHRIVRFRQFLDEVLGGGNRFWSVHRNPPWAADYVDYQVIEPGTLTRVREAL